MNVSASLLSFPCQSWTGLIISAVFAVLCCPGKAALAFQTNDAASQFSTDQLFDQISASKGDEKTRLQLQLLRRADLTPQQLETVADRVLQNTSESNSPIVLGTAYSARGKSRGEQGRFEEAIQDLKMAADIARQSSEGDKLLFRVLCNRAIFSNVIGQREEATALIHEALELAQSDEERYEVAFAHSVLAHIAESAGAFEEAFDNLRIAFEKATRTGKTELAAQAGINMIELAISEGNLSLAMEFIELTQSWIKQSKDPRIASLLNLRRQDIRRFSGDPRGAAEELESMIANFSSELDGSQEFGLLHLSLADCHVATGEFDSAIEVADRASELLKPYFRTWTLVQLVRARAVFGRGESQKALSSIDSLLEDQRTVTVHRVELLSLRSTVLAALSRFQESLESLRKCRQLEDERDSHRARQIAHLSKLNFENRQRDLELSMSKAREAGAKAQADLSALAADQEADEADRARSLRNLSIVLAIASVVAISLFFRLSWKRRIATALMQNERILNDKLKHQLEQRSAELVDQVSKRQELELAMERKLRDEAIGKLTGGVAHDFNNLLTVIVHSTDLIRSKLGVPPTDVQELLAAIDIAADSGASIVDQLMTYSRQQPLVAKPVSVSSWFASTRTILRQTIGSTINYTELEKADGAVINTDAAKLTTAIINLLANARDALATRGNSINFTIQRIEIRPTEQSQWRNVPPGAYCLFEVQDDGVGMSSSELSRACEPFYSTKAPGTGTGLGLSSVLGFVRQSGGDFRLTSELNQGTAAAFIVPVVTDGKPVVEERLPVREAIETQLVLLVEDQDAVRQVLCAGLESMSYRTIAARNADEAIIWMQLNGIPDVVLSDVRMPGSMDGVGLRTWVLKRNPNARVILMSGYREVDGQDDSLVLLPKPVKLADLRSVLTTR